MNEATLLIYTHVLPPELAFTEHNNPVTRQMVPQSRQKLLTAQIRITQVTV